MIRNRRSDTALCMILALTCALVATPARADDGIRENPIRLYASEQFGPIGRVYSLGVFVIDGRPIYGEQTIWGGELIQTVVGSCVSVDIARVGRITLKNTAMARLATTPTKPHLVVASLIDGDLVVKLLPDGMAYIESCGSTFTSSMGASFDVRTRDGKAFLNIASGTVDVQTSRRRTTIRATTVRMDPNLRPVTIGAAPLNTRTGQSAQASSEWRKFYEGTGTSGQIVLSTPRLVMAGYYPAQQPAPTDEPAANRIVLFHLEPASLGTIDPQGKTDNQGVVTVTVTGRTNGIGRIVGEIVPDSSDPPGTIYETYHRVLHVTKFWTPTKFVLGAAAIAGVSVCVVACGSKGKPLRQAPPPIIE